MAETKTTELPSRYDPNEFEERLHKEWAKADWLHAEPSNPGEPFTIVIPPPNVTGFLHIGHALNNTLQDILTRWHRMRGDNTLWLPGTDHAGIATQSVVERNLRKKDPGFDRKEMGREKFLEHVWDWKEQFGARIISQLKRLGASADWSRERFTMDEGLSNAVLTVFKRLFDEGLIYRGEYMVNWSTALRTAISDDEVEQKEVKSHLWHMRYPLTEGEGYLEVATTRPETMLGDTAVAVHPEDERYKHLIGKTVTLPIMNREIPIVGDEYVDREFGSGAVKITPAHDPNDYEIGKRHDLPFINLMEPDGITNDNAGEFAGMTMKQARAGVVAKMEELDLMVRIEDHVHNVGHCQRSGCVVEPYISMQWFVKMKPLVEPAVAAVKEGRIKFVPESYANMYFGWMENVRDWCISRQLWWGHRIPVYYCEDCGHYWCEIGSEPTVCPKCGGNNIHQDPDVLDTWFSSALWPFSTLGWPEETEDLKKYYPTSVLVTSHDIIFFWVARMIIMGLKFMDEVPFHTVAINAMVMDKHGKKMSKSSGNAIDPIEVIDKHGTDAIRLTLASYPTLSRTISLSEKKFETFRNFNNKLWNATRFVLMNVEGFDPASLRSIKSLDDLELEDRWILTKLKELIEASDKALNGFEFDHYVDAIYKFTWNTFCDWYVELVKTRLHGEDAASKAGAQAVLLITLESLLRLMHPVAPFITSEIWDRVKLTLLGGSESASFDAGEFFNSILGDSLKKDVIVVTPWPSSSAIASDDNASQRIELIQEAIYRIRNIRGEMGVAPGQAVKVEITGNNDEHLDILRNGSHYINSLVKIESLNIANEVTLDGFTSTAVMGEETVHVELPAELVEAERKRLDKEIARLEKGVKGIEGKLNNEKFVANAPAELVQKEKDRMEKLKGELEQINDRRKQLG